jgi:hypothetical protein
MSREDIELAEEHVKLAEEIVIEESKKSGKSMEGFEEAEFAPLAMIGEAGTGAIRSSVINFFDNRTLKDLAADFKESGYDDNQIANAIEAGIESNLSIRPTQNEVGYVATKVQQLM